MNIRFAPFCFVTKEEKASSYITLPMNSPETPAPFRGRRGVNVFAGFIRLLFMSFFFYHVYNRLSSPVFGVIHQHALCMFGYLLLLSFTLTPFPIGVFLLVLSFVGEEHQQRQGTEELDTDRGIRFLNLTNQA